VVLFFSANWSEECKQMLEVFNELSKDKKITEKLRVLEIEAEEHEDITLKYGIDVVPSFVFVNVR
jgi:thioredoxin-like negative regulator of GroEL